MTLLVTIESLNVLEVPLRLPGNLPFVLLSLQLQLGLSAVWCQVTKLPALTTSEGLVSIRGIPLFPLLSNPPFSLQYNYQPVYQLPYWSLASFP